MEKKEFIDEELTEKFLKIINKSIVEYKKEEKELYNHIKDLKTENGDLIFSRDWLKENFK